MKHGLQKSYLLMLLHYIISRVQQTYRQIDQPSLKFILMTNDQTTIHKC